MQLFRKFFLSVLYFFSKKEIEPLLKESQHLKDFKERSAWLQRLVGWVAWNERPRKEFDSPELTPQAARLRFLIRVIEKKDEIRKAVGIQLWTLLNEGSSQDLFSEVGLTREGNVFGELATRLWQKFLPAPVKENDLSELFDKCFGKEEIADWVSTLPKEDVAAIQKLIQASSLESHNPVPGLQESISEALLILGAKVASVGLGKAILERSPNTKAHASPFLQFNEEAMLISRMLREGKKGGSLETLEEKAARCESAIEEVLKQIEVSGVSVHLVFDLECLQSWIKRTRTLSQLCLQTTSDATLLSRFVADLARESVLKRSVLELIKENIHLLSRKIVERTGVSGEHYITKGFSDYFLMLYRALGGGLLMAFTTVQKYFISLYHFPLFFEGFFYSLNYAGSFVALQLFHFTLATKQPSMTAPNLAGKLLEFQENDDIFPFINEVARITRSHLIAIIGNIGAVIPMALFLDKLWVIKTGQSIYTLEYAEHALHAMHPLHSGSLFYAFFTGILLWASSVCAGWFENWVVFERIPEAIGQSRNVRWVFGKKRAPRVGNWFLKESAGFAGNISLGFFLGFIPVLAKFFGVPLDVRHVTLSAGSFGLATGRLLQDGVFQWEMLLWPGIGMLCIGFLNVVTCFFLALFVATRARKVRKGATLQILKAVFLTFLKRPAAFLFPPRN